MTVYSETYDTNGEPNFFFRPLRFIRHQLEHINRKLDIIMASQKDEAAQLTALAAEITNISNGIDALEAAITNAGNTTPEVDAALAQVQAAADAALAKLPAPTPTPPPAA